MTLLATAPLWPFGILVLCVLLIILLIAVLRVHPFISLLVTAVFAGLLSSELPGPETQSHWVKALEVPLAEFGILAGKIAFVIVIAAIIGTALMESGAADRVAQSMLKLFGERYAGWALMISGFFLSIPVFFDTVFFLLIPLAIALSLRMGKNYTLFVMAICGGGAITHSMVPPTPGPLLVAEIMELNLGMTILAGLGASILPAIAVIMVSKWVNARLNIPVRVALGGDTSSTETQSLPSLIVSILPVVIPVLLISMDSIASMLVDLYADGATLPRNWLLKGITHFFLGTAPIHEFLGNKNLAMFLGMIIALMIWVSQRGLSLKDLSEKLGPPIETAGVIILITCAGGAFGAMIRHAGVGEAVQWVADAYSINYILLAYIITLIMRAAQGSATVAMITGASIMAAILKGGVELSYSPLYIFLAVGFGSIGLSWMNDSGFWVVSKLSGFTERETLRTWSLLLFVISIVGLFELMIFSQFL